MKRLLLPGLVALSIPAAAQVTATLPVTCNPAGTICITATPIVNPNGSTVAGGTGGGGGGDASASNQTLQLTQEQLTAARLGDTTSPAAGSVNGRLGSLLTAVGSPYQAGGALPLPSGAATSGRQDTLITALGAPFQAGGLIGNSTFASTQSGTWNLNNITGTVSLPTGAATLAAQATGNGYLATLAGNSGQSGAPYTWSTTGTLAALNATVDLVAPGSASALIDVASTNFIGTISAFGCADSACTVLGGRLLFKSGVGSIGTNSVVMTGGTMAREYRVVAGGNRFRIVATAYTSGTASVTMLAQPNSNILFINGPVHGAEEEALRAGRAYIMTTGMQGVSAGNYLNATISNPTGSGVNVFVTSRMFECNQATANVPAEWITFGNPTTVPTTTASPTNRMVGGAASQTVFRYQLAGTPLTGGVTADSGTVSTGGGPTPNMVLTTLIPGQTGGVSIGGGGGGLAAAQRCKVSYVIYEESTN